MIGSGSLIGSWISTNELIVSVREFKNVSKKWIIYKKSCKKKKILIN